MERQHHVLAQAEADNIGGAMLHEVKHLGQINEERRARLCRCRLGRSPSE